MCLILGIGHQGLKSQVSNITVDYPRRDTPIDWTCTEILWSFGDAPGVQLLTVDISTDGGDTWEEVNFFGTHEEGDSRMIYNDGYLVFSPPHAWTTRALIRLADYYNPDDFTLSQPITISSPIPENLQILQPQAGDRFVAGTSLVINWDAVYLDGQVDNCESHYDVDVEYSVNGGADWIIIEAHSANDGLFIWRIPGDFVENDVYVRVSHVENGFSFISEVGPLSIVPPTWETYFINVSGASGVDLVGNYRCASWVDISGNGFVDLFVTGADGDPNVLYVNNGDGTFSQAPLQNEVEDAAGYYRAGVFGDINNDGLSDLYLGGGENTTDKLLLNTGNQVFEDITAQAGIEAHTEEANGVAFLDYDLDGFLDIFVCMRGMKNLLYHNNGDVTFSELSNFAGVAGVPAAQSSAVAVGDYDRDGDSDLYVANSAPEANAFYRNNGNGTFTNITEFLLSLSLSNCKTAEWGDFDNNGLLDLFVTRRHNSNLLFRHNFSFDEAFTDVTEWAGVGDEGESVVMATGDFDSDGYVDMCVGNRSSEGTEKILLYMNNGDGSFIEVGDQSGMTPVTEPRGMAVADYDKDGDLDLFVANWGGPSKLFENKLVDQNRNHWLKVLLRGVVSNREAIGTRVMIRTGKISQLREVQVGTGYGNGNSLELEFGLGSHQTAESMAIHWPSGMTHTFSQLTADSVYIVQELPDSVLEVQEGTLTITYPTEGAVFRSGTTEQILWEATGDIDSVRIELTTDAGGQWDIVATTVNNGAYNWPIPRFVYGDLCQIRISDTSDGVPSDTGAVFVVELVTLPLDWEIGGMVQEAGMPFWVSLNLGSEDQPVFSLKELHGELEFSIPDHMTIVPDSIVLGSMWGIDPVQNFQENPGEGKISFELQRADLEGGFDGYGEVIRVQFMAGMYTPDSTTFIVHPDNLSMSDTAGYAIPVESTDLTLTIVNDGIMVWPGDTNNDGIVNQEDVLPLGLYWGAQGQSRVNGSGQWMAQKSIPWVEENAMYSDGNGDGRIDGEDVFIINRNWGMDHVGSAPILPMGETPEQAIIRVRVSDHTPYEPFTTDLRITQGDSLFGVSIVFYYDAQLIEIDSVESGPLWGNETVLLFHDDPSVGEVGMGISQKAGQEKHVNTGVLVNVHMRLRDGVGLNTPVVFRIDNAFAINHRGERLSVTTENSGYITDVDDNRSGMPDAFRLHPNYPNPFNPTTTISYDLPENTRVVLRIYDTRGQEVRSLVDEFQESGYRNVRWDGKDDRGIRVSSGLYMYKIIAGDFTSSRKCLLMK